MKKSAHSRLPLDLELIRLAEAGEIEKYEHPAWAELAAAFVEAVPEVEPAVPAWVASQGN